MPAKPRALPADNESSAADKATALEGRKMGPQEEVSMRCKAVFLGAALLLLGASAANAARTGSTGSTWLGVSGGAGIPTGDYGDAAGTGWHLGVTGTRMLNDQFGIGGDAGYHAWGPSEDVEDALAPGEEISWSAVQATAHGILMFPTRSNVKPYARFGLGLYNVGFDFESPSGDFDDSESKLGFNLGGGMNFLTSGNTRWGMAAALHFIPAEDDLGADVNFLTLGVNVLWGIR
jgi:opacity protein-like surface antigen